MAEYTVAKADELKDGEMKKVEAGGMKVLLIRQGGEFSALGGECPHQGAGLAEGLLHEGHVRCPWHQACFCARSGDLQQPPALDGLTRFDVKVRNGEVVVSMPREARGSRVMPMAELDPDADGRTFVVVGSGAAGSAAAEALRQNGYQGRVVVCTREDAPPYDRTELSKHYLSKKSAPEVSLRPQGFYNEHQIELMLSREVVAVEPEARRIVFADGPSLAYDACLLATGSRARRLPIAGMDLENVFTLRSLREAAAIRSAAAEAGNVVVVGAGFIGAEVASSLSGAGRSVTVVAPESVPMERVLGKDVGRVLKRLHEENGTTFALGTGARAFEGDGAVEAVLLDDGKRLDADLVVVGIGVQPVTDYLKGVPRNEDGSVSVDGAMRVTDGLWAAGDIARFPDPVTGEPIRVEHWRLAAQLGRVAALSMLGGDVTYDDIPFFWTDQAGATLAYVGHAVGWDETIVDGDLESGEGFLVFYAAKGRVTAACAVYRDKEMDAVAELLRKGLMPGAAELRAGLPDLVQKAATAAT